MSLLLLSSLAISNRVYVILGGTSAANTNQYIYTTNNSRVFSFNLGQWNQADSPMPGGDGDIGSFWPYVGDKLQNYYNDNIYFVDCARQGADITDWAQTGKYKGLSQYCFSIAEKITENYSVLWQEGKQDNIYSYNTDFFITTIQNLIRSNQIWYISVLSYPGSYSLRWDKISDLITLIRSSDNIYLGADIDSLCIENITFDQRESEQVADLWFRSIINKDSPLFGNDIFYTCEVEKFNDFIMIFACLLILLFTCSGFYYCYKYYKRRKYYISINS